MNCFLRSQERKDTGRIYLMNVDHANTHGAFIEEVAPVKQSNLCCEIDLITKLLTHPNDEEGEISLCTLSAVNWGVIKDFEEMNKVCKLAVRGFDELLDHPTVSCISGRTQHNEEKTLGHWYY